MVAQAPLAEYLREIRQQVCALCIERRPGGPPCVALGKWCGVEAHLSELVSAIRRVHSPLMGPYEASTECLVCQGCAAHFSSDCPCPMGYLLPLVVEVVEAVDQRDDPPAR